MKKTLLTIFIVLAELAFSQTHKVDFENKLITYATPNKDTINVSFLFVNEKGADSFNKSITLGLIHYANTALKYGKILPKSFLPLFYRFEYKWKKNGKHKYEVTVKYSGVNSFGLAIEQTSMFKFNHKLKETFWSRFWSDESKLR